jgi:hypothetical protein
VASIIILLSSRGGAYSKFLRNHGNRLTMTISSLVSAEGELIFAALLPVSWKAMFC